MFFDLKTFDVVDGHCKADCGGNDEDSDASLDFKTATEGAASNHQGADVGEDCEGGDCVAVYSVEHEEFVANCWDELEEHQDACGENGTQMEGYADAVVANTIPMPFGGIGAIGKRGGL